MLYVTNKSTKGKFQSRERILISPTQMTVNGWPSCQFK